MKFSKILIKWKCRCGRKVIIENTKITKGMTVSEPVCSMCKTYGLNESRRLFVQEKAEVKRKSEKTIFNINIGKEFKPRKAVKI